MRKLDQIVWAEMARRKQQFHADKEWSSIKLWGLFQWGMVSKLIKSGDLITDMQKENKTVWVRPSPEAYRQYIEPLLSYPIERLTTMAGWN